MTEKTKRSEPKIRRAKSGDAASLAALSGELGYPATAAEIKSRLSRLKSAANDALFVAECDGEVIGWLHISVNHLIEVPTRAEINAFIVSEKQRSNGAGASRARARFLPTARLRALQDAEGVPQTALIP